MPPNWELPVIVVLTGITISFIIHFIGYRKVQRDMDECTQRELHHQSNMFRVLDGRDEITYSEWVENLKGES